MVLAAALWPTQAHARLNLTPVGQWLVLAQLWGLATALTGIYPKASASSISVLTTISGRASSVSNRPPERSIHAACIPAFRAPITSKGFEEISRTFSMALPSLSATCRYTFGEGLYTFTSSTLTKPWKYL